jgi:hypothetical protein
MNQNKWGDYHRDHSPPSQTEGRERCSLEDAVNAFPAEVSTVSLVKHQNDRANVLVERCIFRRGLDPARVASGLAIRSELSEWAGLGVRPGVRGTKDGLHMNAPQKKLIERGLTQPI